MWLNNFSSNVLDRKDGVMYESTPYHPKFPIEGYRNYVITIDKEYRADKIAFELYGSAELSWVLDVANNFTHAFKDYKEGRVIRVPTIEALQEMRII